MARLAHCGGKPCLVAGAVAIGRLSQPGVANRLVPANLAAQRGALSLSSTDDITSVDANLWARYSSLAHFDSSWLLSYWPGLRAAFP
jgi:hypothetical protein